MRAYIGNTDYEWYSFLKDQPELDEANFWKPSGRVAFRALDYGEPFFFKLKKAHDYAIVGFGLFLMYRALPLMEAWETFGIKNGAASLQQMWTRISAYTKHSSGQAPVRHHKLGCILLSAPVFFPQKLWVEGPRDWSPTIVSGKTYDTSKGEGHRIWNECMERLPYATAASGLVGQQDLLRDVEASSRFGKEQRLRPRLGQGTFRYAVQDAYGKCAITREHSLPALEAAHIIPYAEGGGHEIANGLLMRADVHHLFDRGYVTVTPEYTFRVSERLEQEFNNGKVYYQLQSSKIWLPPDPASHPKRENLEYHNDQVFEQT